VDLVRSVVSGATFLQACMTPVSPACHALFPATPARRQEVHSTIAENRSPVQRASPYSYLNATLGSAFAARRAGM
jgi:hypothetical protein